MPPFRRSRAQRVASAGVFLALAGIGFLPLFGGPGYEHALASGLVVPSSAAVATAFDLAQDTSAPPARVRRGLLSGAWLALVAFVTACLQGMRVGFCDFSGAAVFFILTAGVGSLLGGVWGAIAAELTRTLRPPPARGSGFLRVALALAAPLAGIGVSVARFYGSPMIFAYDPFFGYFSGTLYDTVIDVRSELWTYRAGTASTLVGVALAAEAFARSEQGRLRFAGSDRSMRSYWALGAASCVALVNVVMTIEGPALGHFQTSSTIARALGARVSGPRCDVFYPDAVLPADAQLMLLDCEQELAAVERSLATHLDARLSVFEFADAAQKRALMGAADTSIAKPWRHEVYVQVSSYPHPVLGHEIAHAVSAAFARGPFAVGGGWWPDPGLIEGVAVAASPDDDELTATQWTRAMLEVGLLPPARRIFSLGFLGESADRSYTVAGAFVQWAMARWGSAMVHAWYGGDRIEDLTHLDWNALDREFRGWIVAQPMPEAALAYARARFGRPSLWKRRCPHAVDALDGAADRCRDDHRFEQSSALYARALATDPGDWRARFGWASLAAHAGDRAAGIQELTRIGSDESAPQTWRDRADETIADDALLHGRSDDAARLYALIAARTVNEDYARTLEVKMLGARDPFGPTAVVDLLIGEPGRPPDAWLAAVSMTAWALETKEALPEYLLGKNLLNRGEWERARGHLERATAGGAPTDRIGRELLRDRVLCACARADTKALEDARGAIASSASPFARGATGRRESVLRLVDRCLLRPSLASGSR
jgi:hypothetical protein